MGALLGLAIALPDRSVDSSLFTQLFTRLRDLYRTRFHTLDTIRSLDRTYPRSRTVSCDSLVSIEHLANEPLHLGASPIYW